MWYYAIRDGYDFYVMLNEIFVGHEIPTVWILQLNFIWISQLKLLFLNRKSWNAFSFFAVLSSSKCLINLGRIRGWSWILVVMVIFMYLGGGVIWVLIQATSNIWKTRNSVSFVPGLSMYNAASFMWSACFLFYLLFIFYWEGIDQHSVWDFWNTTTHRLLDFFIY